jgi:hypothetical protein
VNGPGIQEYRTEAGDNSLVLGVRPAAEAAPVRDSGGKGLEGAKEVVESFLAGQVQGADVRPFLDETARAQFSRLPAFRPTEYKIIRQSGQTPDTLLYEVRLSNQDAFTDQFLVVTPGGSGPQISLALGHPPVDRPADPDGRAALTAAFAYLDAWMMRDAKGMYAALAPSSQQSLTKEQGMLLGGPSNPHPFRYEIHAVERIVPGCYRMQVLQSMEYTGDGELGRGIGPLHVRQEGGRYGVLLESDCAR